MESKGGTLFLNGDVNRKEIEILKRSGELPPDHRFVLVRPFMDFDSGSKRWRLERYKKRMEIVPSVFDTDAPKLLNIRSQQSRGIEGEHIRKSMLRDDSCSHLSPEERREISESNFWMCSGFSSSIVARCLGVIPQDTGISYCHVFKNKRDARLHIERQQSGKTKTTCTGDFQTWHNMLYVLHHWVKPSTMDEFLDRICREKIGIYKELMTTLDSAGRSSIDRR